MTTSKAIAGVVLAIAFAFGGCGAPQQAASSSSSSKSDLAPKFAPGPWASALTQACTPSGAELCFNAIDDNCNGVIDEGCGVCTGPLQFTIAWAEPNVDVDLAVIDPTGAKASDPRSPTPSGLKLDRDCPKDGCQGQNLENICSEVVDPPRGRYVLEIRLDAKAGAVTPATKVRVGVRVGDKSYGAELELSPMKDQETISFVL